MESDSLKVGVVGVGHLGQHHVKHYAALNCADLVGIYDTDRKKGQTISKRHNITAFKSMDIFLENINAVSIVTPTCDHAAIAEACIEAGKHVFIEKPITQTLDEADHILALAVKHGVLVQVGHIERLNPALLALKSYGVQDPISWTSIEIDSTASGEPHVNLYGKLRGNCRISISHTRTHALAFALYLPKL